MGLSTGEGTAVVLCGLAIAAVTLSLFDLGWSVVRDRNGDVLFGGLLETEIRTFNGLTNVTTTVVIDNEELESKFAGQMTALVLFAGLAAGLGGIMNTFLVGSGNIDREKGHMLAIQFMAAGGVLFLGACGTFSFLHPSEWEYHDDNTDFITIGNGTDATTIAQPRKSIDHFGTSFVITLLSSQFYFWAGIILYFVHSRITFS